MQIKTNKLKGSLVEIEGSLPWDKFEKYQSKALKNIGVNMQLPGFRKGHIPEDVLIKNISDISLLEEMAQTFLSESYPEILIDNKIDAIGRPEIAITKLGRGNPLEFKIKTSILPLVKLPDYKQVAGVENKNKKVEKVEVSDDEVEKSILQIRKMRSEHKDHDHETKEEDLPVFDDAFVKSLGNFENMEDFKVKIKENIALEKNNKEKEKQRIKIIEAILDKTDIDLPRILIDSELDRMLHQVKTDIENSGFKFEDYMKHLNKTEEEMKKEWEKEAEKRAKLELLLKSIADAENIKIDEKDIEQEVGRIMDMYKDADRNRAQAYVENILKNEKIFQLLENYI